MGDFRTIPRSPFRGARRLEAHERIVLCCKAADRTFAFQGGERAQRQRHVEVNEKVACVEVQMLCSNLGLSNISWNCPIGRVAPERFTPLALYIERWLAIAEIQP